MKKLATLIVDDESSARENLISKITKVSDQFEIIGESQNIDEAEKAILRLKPDIVFLDIQMPKGSGFDLLDRFIKHDFQVVFVTAYDDYALKAFEYFAVGYLLKPIDTEQLKLTLDNVINKYQNNLANNHIESLLDFMKNNNSSVVAIPSETGLEFVDFNDIIYLEADDGYSFIYFNSGNKVISSKSLQHFTDLLPEQFFYKLHRKYIVNMTYLKSYHKVGFVVLKNEVELPVAKSKRSEFTKLFK